MATDQRSGLKFLVDSGAKLSVLPATYSDILKHRADSSNQRVLNLLAANGTPIQNYGTREMQIILYGKSYTWKFVLADVRQPILGGDFLSNFGLLVDIANQRLLHSITFEISQLQQTNEAISIEFISDCRFQNLLRKYPSILKPDFSLPVLEHGVYHRITTNCPSIFSRVRRLTPEKLAIAKAEFKKLEEMGIVRRSNSPWSSPLHLVPKSNGEWRPCGDYRRLNNSTVADRYPIPLISDFTSNIAGAKIFSKIDLIRGYHQVPVHHDDIPKTAITTPFGMFEYLRMPFGLKNAGATFQRLMHKVLDGLSFVFVYLDDILIFSESPEEHEKHVDAVLKRLNDNHLVLRSEKCLFGAEEIEFLGHLVNKDGIRPLPSKVTGIQCFPEPAKVKELQKFLGIINFYHRFIPNASSIMQPLYRRIAQQKPNDEIQLNSEEKNAFQESKDALQTATILAHPLPYAKLRLSVDASDTAIGAVLEQITDKGVQPLGFFSRRLQNSEKRYSVFDRELLAAYCAVKHFRFTLEAKSFELLTDHKPLTQAFHRSGDPWSARQQRQLSYISEFPIIIKYIKGSDNDIADFLSRPTSETLQRPRDDSFLSSLSMGLNFEDLSDAQKNDPEVKDIQCRFKNLCWSNIDIPNSDKTLLCDTSTGTPRPFIPSSFRKIVFDQIHSLSHPSIRSTRRLLCKRFIWPGMAREVNKWSRNCQHCQTSKVIRHTQAPVHVMQNPTRRFSHLHLDIVGPLPPSDGFSYLLTVIDRASRWPEVFPICDITASTVARAFLNGWIARYGVPNEVTTDRGTQFTSSFFRSIAEISGIEIHHTTAFHPQSNGLIERFHRQLKASLMSRLKGDKKWTDHLPWVLLGIRTVPKEDGISSADRLFGEPLVVPGQFFPCSETSEDATSLQRLRETVGSLSPPRQPVINRPSFIHNALQESDHVFVRIDSHRSPLTRPYQGPFLVIKKLQKPF